MVNVLEKLKNFFSSTKRILLISKKPTPKEFWTMAKIVGLGIAIIGIVGFIIRLIFLFI